MDFSEFISELMIKFTGTYKTPNPKEIANSIENHLNIRKYDDDENNPDNRFTGLNGNIKDDSWEAEEERRLELERARLAHASAEQEKLEQARLLEEQKLALAKQQAEEARQAQIRQQEEERLAKIKLEEERARRKITKEQELARAKQECKDATAVWNKWSNSTGRYMSRSDPEHIRQDKKCQDTWKKVGRLQQELKDGNY